MNFQITTLPELNLLSKRKGKTILRTPEFSSLIKFKV